MNVGETKALKVTATNGKGDTIKFTSSNKATVKVNKASAVANSKKVAGTTVTALKAGTAKITATSKNTGKKKAFTITVVDATPAVTPSTNPAVVATTPAVTNTTTPGTNPGGSTSTTTKAPTTTSGAATTAPGSTDAANTNAPGTSSQPGTSNEPGTSSEPGSTDAANTNAPDSTDAPSVSTEPAVTATPAAVEFTAKQTGQKKIVITNPTAMSKSDITITRGSATVPVEKIVFTDPTATTAEVTLTGSIVAVEYTVAVGDTTVKFTGEASKVQDIQITSDVVAMDGEVGKESTTTGTVNYKVTNQFGEDITATTSIDANSSAFKAEPNTTKGYVTLTWSAAPRLNDVVSLVLIYKETGVSVSKVLTVKDQAAPAEVEVYGVYNEDGKKLTATNAGKEDFYFMFRVKDQYGNYMDSSKINAKNVIMNCATGLTNIELDETVTPMSVDGVNYIGYRIDLKEDATTAAAGEVTVMLIPAGSGKTSTTTFKVENGNTVVTFNASVSGSVPSGGIVDLDYVALDENGDDVTDYRVLREIESSDKNFEWVKENGNVVLRYTDPNTSEGSTVSTVFTLPSYETKLVTINIKAPCEAASIGSLNSDLSTATLLNRSITVTASDFNLLDQYSNSYVNNICADLSNPADGDIAVMVEAENEDGTNFSVSGKENAKYTTDANVDLATITDDNAVIITGTTPISFAAADTLCSKNITFKLVKYSATGKKGAANDSTGARWVDYEATSTTSKMNYTQTGAYTATLTATKESKFTSYTVNDITSVYAEEAVDSIGDAKVAYQPTVVVKGVLNNGQTVTLNDRQDYKIVVADDAVDYLGVDGSTLLGYNDNFTDAADASESKVCNYKVVINEGGTTIDKTVTVSEAAPSVKTIKFKSDASKGINVTAVVADSETTEGTISLSDLTNTLKAVDSYGIDSTSFVGDTITLADGNPHTAKFTVSDVDSVHGKVINNGKENIGFSNFAKGDSFTLTVTCEDATFSTVVSVRSTKTQAQLAEEAAAAAEQTLANEQAAVRSAFAAYTGCTNLTWEESGVDLGIATSELDGTNAVDITLPNKAPGSNYTIEYTDGTSSNVDPGTITYSNTGDVVTVAGNTANDGTHTVSFTITSASNPAKTITGTITITATNAEV